MPLFRGSSRFESLISSHDFRFDVTPERNKDEINDGDDRWGVQGPSNLIHRATEASRWHWEDVPQLDPPPMRDDLGPM